MPKNPEHRHDRDQPSSLAHRVILVTGAGDGIGRAASVAFAAQGARLVLLGRTRRKLEQVSDTIQAKRLETPLIVPVDLQGLGPEQAKTLAEGINREFGGLDGVLHNASIVGPKVPIERFPLDEFRKVLSVNFDSAVVLTQALLPLLSQSADASVVFTSSGVGKRGRAYFGAYAVSKFATEGLAEVLADELRNTTRIRVNVVDPGPTRTALRAAGFPSEDPMSLPAPEDHMPLYLYLMGPESAGVTGRRFAAKGWRAG